MIVADTSLVARLFLASASPDLAEEVARADPEWAAPRLWRSELRNVLATQMRAGRLDLGGAMAILDRAQRLFTDREFEQPSLPIMELAAASSCTAYDCEFVALAMRLGVPLVTLDTDLQAAFPRIARSPAAYLAD